MCGLPQKIAPKRHQPFIIRRLKELGHADTIKTKGCWSGRTRSGTALEEVIRNHPVLRSRPALHHAGVNSGRCWW